MTAIVKRSVFAVKRSPMVEASELSGATGRCPATHTPIATLRVAMTWTQQPKCDKNRDLGGDKTTAFACVAVVIAVLLVAAGTFMATTYLSGLLMQSMHHLQRYNEPQAQYSEVGNWQRRR